MAGDEGFEPPITGPEPVALPLGQSPVQGRIILDCSRLLNRAAAHHYRHTVSTPSTNTLYLAYNMLMIRRSQGFTIVELVIVITVIAILTAIVTLGFSLAQSKSRDSERVSSVKLIAESLEKYYDQNGEYPPCTAMTDTGSNVSNNTLSGIDKAALVAPQDTAGTTNSIKCTDMTSASQGDYFAYVGDGSTNCQTGDSCLSFTLKYKIESTGQVGTITGRRNTNIATSGTPTTTASATGFTTANVSWTGVNNSISYTVQWATDSGFTTNLTSTTYTGVNASVSGLSYNTTYYVRTRANASAGSYSNWSPTVSIATWGLSTPSYTALNASSTTTFYGNWNAVSHAASYTLQLSSDGTTWSGWQYPNITGTTYTWTGAAPGWRYFARMQAVNGSFTSAWSTVAVTALPIDTPSVSMVANTSTTFTSSWGGISGAQSYNVQCSSDNVTWGSGCQASTTGTSFGWGPTYQGRPLYTRTQAVGEYTVGAWSASAVATTWIDTPAAPTYQGPASFKTSVNGNYYYSVVNYASYCPAGTSLQGATFRTVAWGQNFGPHPFGFNDWWATYGGAQAGTVQYYGHYYCNTSWASSPWSPESYNVVTTYW